MEGMLEIIIDTIDLTGKARERLLLIDGSVADKNAGNVVFVPDGQLKTVELAMKELRCEWQWNDGDVEG